ncbi:MAG: hypothetical protein U0903_19775 [Planctomycetales bacterium]
MRIDKVLRPVVDGTWMEGFDWKEEVRSIQCPLMLGKLPMRMLSDEDAYCREAIRDCAVVPLKSVGHVMHWPRTQDVIYQTMQFLGEFVISGDGNALDSGACDVWELSVVTNRVSSRR